MAAIENRYGIAQRWFRHKAGLLGLDRLALADQYAPLGGGRPVPYEEARGVVDTAFRGFSEEVAGIARAFFDERRVDAEPRPGKRGGAFCASVAQDAEPYVLLNHTDTLRDLMTHRARARPRHALRASSSRAADGALQPRRRSPSARCPSTFAELHRLRPHAGDASRTRDARGARPRRAGVGLRDRLPPGDDGPLRAGRVRAAGGGQGADARAARATCGSRATASTTATRSSSPRATASAGATSRTSSTRASTRTPTRSRTSPASCSTRSTASEGEAFVGPYVGLPRARAARPRRARSCMRSAST